MTMQESQDRLVSVSEIAAIAGVGSSAVSNWRKRQKTFPSAVESAPSGDLYRLGDVIRWLEATGRSYSLPTTAEERLWAWFSSIRGQAEPITMALVGLQVYAIRAHALRGASELWGPLESALDGSFSQMLGNALDRLVSDLDESIAVALLPSEFDHISDDHLRAVVQIAGEQILDDLARSVALFTNPWGRGSTVRAMHASSDGLRDIALSLLEPLEGSLHDPAAGSGRGLLAAAAANQQISIFAQEVNRDAWRIGSIALFIVGAEYRYELADTIRDDRFEGLQFDRIFLEPPLGLRLGDNIELANDPRWVFGQPNQQNADLAWVQHAVSHLSDRGRAVVVVGGGALARGGRDRLIRRNLVDADVLDVVIQLPPGLIAGISVPTMMTVLDGQRENRSGSVLFVDATELGTAKRGAARQMGRDDVARIAGTVERWRNGDSPSEVRFANVANNSDVHASDDDLTPSRYIEYTERQTEIDGQMVSGLLRVSLQQVSVSGTRLARVHDEVEASLVDLVEQTSSDSEIEDWPTARLGDVTQSISLGRPVEVWEEDVDLSSRVGSAMQHIVGVTDVADNPMVIDQVPVALAFAHAGGVETREGDVLVAASPLRQGWFGGSAAATVRFLKPALVTQQLIRIRVDESKILPEYLCLVLSSRWGRDALRAVAMGSAVPRLSPSRLGDVSVPIPDLATQEALVDAAVPSMQYVAAAVRALHDARLLSDYLTEALVNQVVHLGALPRDEGM